MEGNYGNYGNYSTTTYNSGGEAGGGGFMPGGSQTSPSGGGGFKNESLRPVTIKQLLEAEPDGSEFKIDGSQIHQVTIIGQVRNISTQTTNITYRLDDGTGVLEVKVWIDPEAYDVNRPQITENTYVRTWGRLKAFSNKRHLGAHFIRPLQDLNEINYHLLEATLVHLQCTSGPPGEAGKGGVAAKGAVGDTLPAGLSNAARAIYKILKTTPSGNEGLHVQDIASRTGLEYADVAKGGDELLNAGLIYTTVDDSTWQILEMGNGY
ncbi:uncharacterized protein PV09_02526 [Verruconis gallopava]|uniref:Replication protein A C-terminal domain-containing protein n=1 Tax=Verruconis gallopava TaxID=253628 RepID=A0A0D1XVM6_9PEZI|nr:uncharacterized protein PV09_02526 [Verruconis gallopava]KIW06846.1 hypothetical protein PV09_02526 [Verruconis gallopava]